MASSDDSLSRINSWLRYWIVISVFSLPSIILDYLNLGHQFTLMKTCFIVWCLLPPPLSGSELIFYQVRKHKLDFLCVCNSVENFSDFSFVQTLPWVSAGAYLWNTFSKFIKLKQLLFMNIFLSHFKFCRFSIPILWLLILQLFSLVFGTFFHPLRILWTLFYCSVVVFI